VESTCNRLPRLRVGAHACMMGRRGVKALRSPNDARGGFDAPDVLVAESWWGRPSAGELPPLCSSRGGTGGRKIRERPIRGRGRGPSVYVTAWRRTLTEQARVADRMNTVVCAVPTERPSDFRFGSPANLQKPVAASEGAGSEQDDGHDNDRPVPSIADDRNG
jgi:hypothetical protein